jgi:hypothetical protein
VSDGNQEFQNPKLSKERCKTEENIMYSTDEENKIVERNESSSEMEKTLSVPNHNDSHNNLP